MNYYLNKKHDRQYKNKSQFLIHILNVEMDPIRHETSSIRLQDVFCML